MVIIIRNQQIATQLDRTEKKELIVRLMDQQTIVFEDENDGINLAYKILKEYDLIEV